MTSWEKFWLLLFISISVNGDSRNPIQWLFIAFVALAYFASGKEDSR